MTLWSFAGLNSPISESNVCNILPNTLNFFEPLLFSRCFLLEVERLNRADLFAIGKSHFDFRLSEVNHWNILLSPEVFFNLNHTYTISEKAREVKFFLKFF